MGAKSQGATPESVGARGRMLTSFRSLAAARANAEKG